jgi:tryptophan 2,3-dioxygenase
VQRQLFEQWSVLETLTPSEYMEFREILGPSSGFQSLQYRTIEFLLGNKNAEMLEVFEHDPAAQAGLREVLRGALAVRRVAAPPGAQGHAVPSAMLERDWSASPHPGPGAAAGVQARSTRTPTTHWAPTRCARTWSTSRSQFQLWRFRHMKHGERIIGFKRGTGGSSGVGFLKQALELTFFPELFEVPDRDRASAPSIRCRRTEGGRDGRVWGGAGGC